MKRRLNWLNWQLADLLTAYVLPLSGAVLPARLNKSWQWRWARWHWLFPQRSAWVDRAEPVYLEEAAGLSRHWRWSTLMEASECWRLLLGLRPRLRVSGQWPDDPGFLAVGMHYGAGMSVLWHLRQAGLSPRFVYREVTAETLPGRPLLYFWYQLRRRLVDRLCTAGPIVTGGARQKLLATVAAGESVPVVLADTPSGADRPPYLQVGTRAIGLRTGIFSLIEEGDCQVVFFSPGIDRVSGRTLLEIRPLTGKSDAATELVEQMNRLMQEDAGQWLLWPSLGQSH